MPGRRLAVLIGATTFPSDPELPALECPERDVNGLAAVLQDPRRGAFDHVESLVDEPSGTIHRAIDMMLNEAAAEDLVLIYYSGHGKPNLRGSLHLATLDTDSAAPAATSIPLTTLRSYLDSSLSRRIVLILDCCFSGRVGDLFRKSGGVVDMVREGLGEAEGVIVMASSGRSEPSYEKAGSVYSAFTGPIVEALTAGAPDHDGDGWVDTRDVMDRAAAVLAAQRLPQPKRWVLDGSSRELPLARSAGGSGVLGDGVAEQREALLRRALGDELDDETLCASLAVLRGGAVDDAGAHPYWRRREGAGERAARILSIDGGGVRVYFALCLLAELEARAGRRTAELFDLVAATGLSAIVALVLLTPSPETGLPRTAAELVGAAPTLFRSIFRGQLGGSLRVLARPIHSIRHLEGEAHALFGEQRLGEIAQDVVIPAYELERRDVFAFRSARAREQPEADFLLRDVAVAAAAAPTMFPPKSVTPLGGDARYVLIDATSVLPHPGMAAYSEARWGAHQRAAAPPEMLSLGVNTAPPAPDADKLGRSGLFEWVPVLTSISTQGAVSATDDQLELVLGDERYVRLQPPRDEPWVRGDAAKQDNFDRLARMAEQVIELRSHSLGQFAEGSALGDAEA